MDNQKTKESLIVKVPRLWCRKLSKTGGKIYYVSPSGHVLTNVKEVLAYLDRNHTCKCSLDTRLKFSDVFNFDPSLKSTIIIEDENSYYQHLKQQLPCEQWCKEWFHGSKQLFRIHLFTLLNYLLTENVSDPVEMYRVYRKYHPQQAFIDFDNEDDDHAPRATSSNKQPNHRQDNEPHQDSYSDWLKSFDWNLVAMCRNGFQLIKDLQWDNLKHLAYEFQISGLMDRIRNVATEKGNCDKMDDTQSSQIDADYYFEKIAQELENHREKSDPNYCDEENKEKKIEVEKEEMEHSERIFSETKKEETSAELQEEKIKEADEEMDTIKLVDPDLGLAFQVKLNTKTVNNDNDDKQHDDDQSPNNDDGEDSSHDIVDILLLDGRRAMCSPPRKRTRFLSASEIDVGCSSVPIEVIEDVDDVIPEDGLMDDSQQQHLSINFELVNDDDGGEEEEENETVVMDEEEEMKIPSENDVDENIDQNQNGIQVDDHHYDDDEKPNLTTSIPSSSEKDDDFVETEEETGKNETDSAVIFRHEDDENSITDTEDQEETFTQNDEADFPIETVEYEGNNQVEDNHHSDDDTDEDSESQRSVAMEMNDECEKDETTDCENNDKMEEDALAIDDFTDRLNNGGINNHDDDLAEMKTRQLYFKRMKRLKSQLEIQGMPGAQPDDYNVCLSPPRPPFRPEERVFNIGDVVWGPYGDAPYWPGKLVAAKDAEQESDDHKLTVRWFGYKGIFTRVAVESLRTLTEGLELHYEAKKKHRRGKRVNVLLDEAIHEAITELENSNDR